MSCFCNTDTQMDWKYFEEKLRGNWTVFCQGNAPQGTGLCLSHWDSLIQVKLAESSLDPGSSTQQPGHPFAGFRPWGLASGTKGCGPSSFSSVTPALHSHHCLLKQHQHPAKLGSWLHSLPPHRALPVQALQSFTYCTSPLDGGRMGIEHLVSASYVTSRLNDQLCSPFLLLYLCVNQILRSTLSGKACLDPCRVWSSTPLGRGKTQAMTQEVSCRCSHFGYSVIWLLVRGVQDAMCLKALAQFVHKGSIQNEAIGKGQLSLQRRNKGLFRQDLISERKQAGLRSQVFFQQSQLLKQRLRTSSSTEVHIFGTQSNRFIKVTVTREITSLFLNDTRKILEGKDRYNCRVRHLHYALRTPNIFFKL